MRTMEISGFENHVMLRMEEAAKLRRKYQNRNPKHKPSESLDELKGRLLKTLNG